ncbi:MAG: U32 family peptidase [Oscillospiraceae bacterium]|jgi:putative protease|nr:U32 family peptidase [Oscillospiraceae bacterium]
MIEILSPAGSPEGVTAAVQNGADAVYMGYPAFNARRGAKNFTPDDFARAAEYCRVRGVKTYLTLNTLVTDRELPDALETAVSAARRGADAIIVTDLGLLRALRQALPEMPLHCSTQMGVHSAEGARLAFACGAKRVVLAREMPKEEILSVARTSPVELEVFVHGAYCVSHSGQCYFSSVIGRRSGNRGACAQPCRLPYATGSRKTDYPLSLRDNSLVSHLEELEKMGVASLKIEGRMKRPEYAAIVTGIYARAAHERRTPTAEDMRALAAAFSRQGFTDGYYTKKLGADMFGVREPETPGDSQILSSARKNYMSGEFQRVPVRFAAEIRRGEPSRLVAADDRRNTAAAEGAVPEPAFHRVTDSATLTTQLHKTGGTPFFCAGVKCRVDPELSLPVAAINELRRAALTELLEKRRAFAPPAEAEYTPTLTDAGRTEPPVLTVSVTRADQLSRELLALAPSVLYIPVSELRHASKLAPFFDSPDVAIAAVLPRVVFDSERAKIEKILDAARNLGITDVLCGNLGQLLPLREAGFRARGDFGLNIFNSHSLSVARDLGLVSATLSFEMSIPQLRDTQKPIDTEIIAYGRLPLMLTENCIIKSALGVCSCGNFSGLTDRTGASFPVIRESADSCRNVVLNSRKLFLADRLADFRNIGLWAHRLAFTTENAAECVSVMRSYLGQGDYSPGGFTRGLYYKGVE